LEQIVGNGAALFVEIGGVGLGFGDQIINDPF
jgi:hypothetical protein